ncbi:hypothetical protein CEB3_c10730 [Peptococcaceae bacterium CEB3]|nr:hypothetical protein CEB3_c10730 [Peptococcaceae bacterium CEB3]
MQIFLNIKTGWAGSVFSIKAVTFLDSCETFLQVPNALIDQCGFTDPNNRTRYKGSLINEKAN